MASFTPFVADEEQVPPTDAASSSESDKEPAGTANWSRRLVAGLAACTATYAIGREAVHGLALDGGVATAADSHGAAPAQYPVLRAMQDDDESFETADAGSADTYPMQAGSLRKGSHVMLKGHPCKVAEVTTSKTGKHGHAKAHIVGLDIFTGKKYEDLSPTSHDMEVPFVKRTEFQLIDANDEGVSLLLDNGDTKDDLNLPDHVKIGEPTDEDKKISQEILKEVEAGDKEIYVTVLEALGQEKIVAVRLTN